MERPELHPTFAQPTKDAKNDDAPQVMDGVGIRFESKE